MNSWCMKFILFSIVTFLSGKSMCQDSFSFKEIAGEWFVTHSNFPMWKKGKKTNPSFVYDPVLKNGDTVLIDKVHFMKNGKQQTYNGIDYSLNENNTSFIWKGTGALRFMKSKWEIVYIASSTAWRIVHFEKTLFSPEGNDVISRNKYLTDQQLKEIEVKLKELGVVEMEVIGQE